MSSSFEPSLVCIGRHGEMFGGGERDAELPRLAVQPGRADRVLFLGIRWDALALLPAFDVSCPSSVHEGIPIPVVEPIATGLPDVATSCGCLPGMVTDGERGSIFSVGDRAALASRLKSLADDPELWQRQAQSARDRVERECTLEQTTQRYENLLVDLVGAR
jgi:glycosyltransferase involved in cell wall biosynthesis